MFPASHLAHTSPDGLSACVWKGTKVKKCKVCGDSKPYDQFHPNFYSTDNRCHICIPCYHAQLQAKRGVIFCSSPRKYKEHSLKTSPYSIREGYVYLIQGGGYYKIGHSTNPKLREHVLTKELPFECSIIHLLKTDNRFALETHWHRRFGHFRIRGEWFRLPQSCVDEFCAYGPNECDHMFKPAPDPNQGLLEFMQE